SVPSAWRGAAVNGMQVAWFAGAAAAYAAGYGLLPMGPDAWRWILASPAAFAAGGLLLRASAPESPMWQAAQRGAAQRIAFGALFSPRFSGPLAFVSAVWLLQVVPLFAIYAFAPAVLSALGLGAADSPIGSFAITLAFLAGSLLSLPLVERCGRRPLCIAGFAVATIAFALLFVAHGSATIVVACFVAYALAIGAAAGLELTYPVELFPTSVRASATGCAAAVSRIGAFAGTFALPVVLERYGIAWVVGGALALSAMGWAIAQLWAPETRGVALE
ncbi:MAG TPA: MFS transporter, partial [Candidatus Tumulicola sp.]|nr:MFS transporter [Candidatus Tumulicola sp.]